MLCQQSFCFVNGSCHSGFNEPALRYAKNLAGVLHTLIQGGVNLGAHLANRNIFTASDSVVYKVVATIRVFLFEDFVSEEFVILSHIRIIHSVWFWSTERTLDDYPKKIKLDIKDKDNAEMLGMGPPCGLSCPAHAVRFSPLGVPD
jgi:hypothetical protein